MLVPDNIHPEETIYFQASFVLKAIQDVRKASMVDLYIKTRTLHEMSMPVFVLCLDWLFLIGLITTDELGHLKLCS